MANTQHDNVPNSQPGQSSRLTPPYGAPPGVLFCCGSNVYHPTQGLLQSPNLTRCNIHLDKVDVVDRFFQWYNNFGSIWGVHGPSPSGTVSLVEVIKHQVAIPQNASQQRASEHTSSAPRALYFVENPKSLGDFEWVQYENGSTQRMNTLGLLTTVLLKCKAHGCSWETNVLG